MKLVFNVFKVIVASIFLAGCGTEAWQDHEGNRITGQDLEGRTIIVNYWAEWCGPCREEIPELNSLAAAHPDLAIYGINWDGLEGEELRHMAEDMGISFPVVGEDFASAFSLPRPSVLPVTYILDAKGDIRHTLQGPQDEKTLLELARLSPENAGG